MRRSALTFFLFISFSIILNAQVGIGTPTPNSSAKLDITSTTQGVLFPRMTAAERAAIVNPALGLFVFQIDGTVGLYYYDGLSWRNITTGLVPSISGDATPTGVQFGVSTLQFIGLQNAYGIVSDGIGNLYLSDAQANGGVYKMTADGGGPYLIGTFNNPMGLAVAGNFLYVVENGTHSIRKIDLTTLANTLVAGNGTVGTINGTGAGASFNSPTGIASSANGNLYVSEPLSGRIRKITASGEVTTLPVSLLQPQGITFNSSGEMLVVVGTSNASIKSIVKIANETTVSFLVTFSSLLGICADTDGFIYASAGNQIIRFRPPNATITGIAGSVTAGAADGTGHSASFNQIQMITINGNYLYVVDRGNGRIRKVVLR